ncbi:MAG: hypothetical protein LDL31_03245, partial [Prosthecobacter sp.]|nr:hypothetical protein [Prosthecobacter sp.]
MKSDALIAAEPHGTLAQLFETFQHRQPVEAAADLAVDGFLKVIEPTERSRCRGGAQGRSGSPFLKHHLPALHHRRDVVAFFE